MCGIFGMFAGSANNHPHQDVAKLAFFALRGLQHRGQESSGIAVSDFEQFKSEVGPGLVEMAFSRNDIEALSLRGQARIAIGHNRYSTSKSSDLRHAQPIIMGDSFAFVHNGNLPSVEALRTFLRAQGVETGNRSDSHLMAQAISYKLISGEDMGNAIASCYPLFTGAFSALIATKTELYAFRDPYGIRPLAIGKLAPSKPKIDIFEFVYFARPDSIIMGQRVHVVRSQCGQQLAKEHPLPVDVIVPIPLTANPVAERYAELTGITLESALVKNRYADRTFITPDQHIRELGVKLKFTAISEVLRGKRVALVDDSIVRGTTSQQLVEMIRSAGATEVHLLICSPPVVYPDFYGIDIKRQNELIAFGRTPEQVAKAVGADSVNYLSLEGLIDATNLPADQLCTSVFTGEYPIDLHERVREIQYLKTAV